MSMSPAPAQGFRVALAAPEPAQADHLGQLLQFEGFTVSSFARAALVRLSPHVADLVVFNDTTLRDRTLGIAQALCRPDRRGPLTLALVADGDRDRGVELVERGLDAYMLYPCSPREFVARVRAMLRRAVPIASALEGQPPGRFSGAVRLPTVDIDPLRRRVQWHGQLLRLTEQEFQLLYFLAGHPGRVFDRQALLDAVWGSDTFVTLRSVDALVKRLRHQLRTARQGASSVETVRGVGYRFAEAPPQHGADPA